MDRSNAVILVVEDEPLILLHSRLAFEDAGFEVVVAEDADDALAHFASRPDIDTLFTDVNLRGDIDGVTLARRVHAEHPGVAIFVTSGAQVWSEDELPRGAQFVSKPYTAAQMCRMIG